MWNWLNAQPKLLAWTFIREFLWTHESSAEFIGWIAVTANFTVGSHERTNWWSKDGSPRQSRGGNDSGLIEKGIGFYFNTYQVQSYCLYTPGITNMSCYTAMFTKTRFFSFISINVTNCMHKYKF